jgi:hypothetical protein
MPETIHPAAVAGAAAGAAFVVLGIPLVALTAALLGAGFSYLPKPAQPNEVIPLRLIGVVVDAFIGGWVAVMVVNVPYTAHYIGAWDSATVVLAGLLAFVMQTVRLKSASYFDRAFQAGLNAIVAFFGKGKGAE